MAICNASDRCPYQTSTDAMIRITLKDGTSYLVPSPVAICGTGLAIMHDGRFDVLPILSVQKIESVIR